MNSFPDVCGPKKTKIGEIHEYSHCSLYRFGTGDVEHAYAVGVWRTFISLSGGLSGAFRSANMLAKEYDEMVHVVDDHRISVTLRHSVLDALALRRQGCTAKEI